MDPTRAAGRPRGQPRGRARAPRHHRRAELLDDPDGRRALADPPGQNPIQRIIVDTYQAVSGTGWRAVDELQAQTEAYVARRTRIEHEVYPHQILRNVIPEIGSYKGDGLYSEERKMIDETRKIFHAPDLAVSATCVRVPVAVGHSEAIHVELERPMSARRSARDPARGAGHRRRRRSAAVTATRCRCRRPGTDPVYVGRIRSDPSHPRGLALWVVGDNLARARR